MAFIHEHILSCIIFSPIIWALVTVLFPKDGAAVKVLSLLFSLITLFLSIQLCLQFDGSQSGFQFAERAVWIPDFGIEYFIGVDGISLFLLLLTTFLMPIIILSGWKYIKKNVRGYLALLFILETGMIGTFLSLDMFLFYIFWESILIPMFFIVGIWGGKERIYAATKFILYTVAGSLPMLIAIIFLVLEHKAQFGFYSATLLNLYKLNLSGGGYFSVQGLVFLAFCLAFAVKVPMFPFHTWLPDAHVQAPTGGSVVLAGILLKLGTYGFIRFAMPLAPEATVLYAPILMGIAVVAIIYGACMALAQTDAKKLIAYSSVSHMGYIVLGIFALNEIGIMGSLYQMLAHGISTGALFLLVGILYERRHTREISEFGGLAKPVPLFATVFIIVTMSSMALPGTNGFIGEFLILQGTFLSNPYMALGGGLGIILGAVYMLWLCQKLLFGKVTNEKNAAMEDLNLREFCYLAPLVALIFIMGLYPKPFLSKMEPSVKYLSESLTNGTEYRPSVSYSSQRRERFVWN